MLHFFKFTAKGFETRVVDNMAVFKSRPDYSFVEKYEDIIG